jgi:hypothetical protein
MNNSYIPESFGSDPFVAKWQVVRGDDCEFKVEFYKVDGVTLEDTSSWTFAATAYDTKLSTSYSLTTTTNSDGTLLVVAPATLTAQWGTAYKTIVNELAFDIQVTINSKPWTPIIGTITVLGDVTRNGL